MTYKNKDTANTKFNREFIICIFIYYWIYAKDKYMPTSRWLLTKTRFRDTDSDSSWPNFRVGPDQWTTPAPREVALPTFGPIA